MYNGEHSHTFTVADYRVLALELEHIANILSEFTDRARPLNEVEEGYRDTFLASIENEIALVIPANKEDKIEDMRAVKIHLSILTGYEYKEELERHGGGPTNE